MGLFDGLLGMFGGGMNGGMNGGMLPQQEMYAVNTPAGFQYTPNLENVAPGSVAGAFTADNGWQGTDDFMTWQKGLVPGQQQYMMNQTMQQQNQGLLGGNGLLSSLYQVGGLLSQFMQFGMQSKYMDMLDEQLGIAKDQWKTTKEEINQIRNTRDRLSAQYSGQPYTPPDNEYEYNSSGSSDSGTSGTSAAPQQQKTGYAGLLASAGNAV